MIEDFILNTAVGAILLTLKNEGKRNAFKKAAVKIFNAIKAAYPDIE